MLGAKSLFLRIFKNIFTAYLVFKNVEKYKLLGVVE
jgi:hypothetical protein